MEEKFAKSFSRLLSRFEDATGVPWEVCSGREYETDLFDQGFTREFRVLRSVAPVPNAHEIVCLLNTIEQPIGKGSAIVFPSGRVHIPLDLAQNRIDTIESLKAPQLFFMSCEEADLVM